MQLYAMHITASSTRHPGLNHAQIHSILQAKLIERIQTLAKLSYCKEPPTFTPQSGVKADDQEEFTVEAPSYQMVSSVCHRMGLNMQMLSQQPSDPKLQTVPTLPKPGTLVTK